jgi:hypothetical protein
MFCGSHYRGFSSLFSMQTVTISNPSPSPSPFAYAFTHAFGLDDAKLESYDVLTGLKSFAQLSSPEARTSQLVFIRGYPSPDWICHLGSQFRIDVEFFRQKLHFLEDKEFYDLPPPPSNSPNILRIRVTSIFKRQEALSLSDIQRLRATETKSIEKYQRRLHTPGESIVRHFSTHDASTFTIEQEISIYLVHKRVHGWTGIY